MNPQVQVFGRTVRAALAIAAGLGLGAAEWSLAQSTTLVSRAVSGATGNSASFAPSLSDDGRYVAFLSAATDLVEGDTSSFTDVFVRDLSDGVTWQVSVRSDGTQSNNNSRVATITGDGRWSAFETDATLVSGDTNNRADVYIHDRQSGETRRVSVGSGGQQVSSDSTSPVIARGGRYIVFTGAASFPGNGDTNGFRDIYIHDLETGTTTIVSRATDGTQTNGPSDWPYVSRDGRFVVFESEASNLVAGDNNGLADVFWRDLQTGEVRRVSVSASGQEANGRSRFPEVSDDGRYVVFMSDAKNLVPSDTNRVSDIFVKDLETGAIARISVDSTGAQANKASFLASISADGRCVCFSSNATNLVADDKNGATDVFRHDRQTGTTERMSVAADGTEGNDASGEEYGVPRRAISADGSQVGFFTRATNFYEQDTNGTLDVFVRLAPIDEGCIAPAIETQPASQTACTHESVTFSVVATGNPEPTYQWFKDGKAIDGATGTSYTVVDVDYDDAGVYTVFVENECGSVTSDSATLTVLDAVKITSQPAGQSVCAGSPASFSVVATGGDPLAYQWYHDAVAIPGAQASTYKLDSAGSGDAGIYTVVVTNECQAVTSDAARLTVDTTVIEPPADQSACVGEAVRFAVKIGAPPPVTYQWRKDGADIAGAVDDTYTIATVESDDAGSYDVTVTSPCGTARSAPAVLTVRMTAVITGQPADQWACEHGSVQFRVEAAGDGPLTYQWRKDGVDIPNRTEPKLELISLEPGNAGAYDVVVTNPCGAVTSEAAALTIQTAIVFTTEPADAQVCVGAGATLRGAVANEPPYSVSWRRNSEWIEGADQLELTLESVGLEDAGTYELFVTNACGLKSARPAELVVLEPPTIDIPPAGDGRCLDDHYTFTVQASGSAPLQYQWLKNSTAIDGATSDSFTLDPVRAEDEGEYAVVVSNACGSVTSDVAEFDVLDGRYPKIVTPPAWQTGCLGGAATFSVDATGSDLTYQWEEYIDSESQFVEIPGATGPTLTIDPVTESDATEYRVGVYNSCGAALGGPATLLIDHGTIEIVRQPADVIGCDTGTARFEVIVSATPPVGYQWRKDGVAIAEATEWALTLGPLGDDDAGDYDVVITTTCGGRALSEPATLTVIPYDPPTFVEQPVSQTLCEGETLTLTATAAGGAPITYQWRYFGEPIEGATETTFTLADIQAGGGGSYDVVATNPCGSAVSAVAEVDVAVRPRIDVPPRDREVGVEDGVELWVRASGGPLAYQWSRNGDEIPEATSDHLLIAAPTLDDGGTYSVRVVNGCGATESNAVTLTVLNQPRAERISTSTLGAEPDQDCEAPSLSAEGRYVVFISRARDLVDGNWNDFQHVYLRDRWRAETLRITQSPIDQGDGASTYAILATDRPYVAFESAADNLVAGDSNDVSDIFLIDYLTHATQRISVAANGAQADGPSRQPAISSFGKFIAFESDARNLVSGDENNATDVFVHNREQRTLVCASVDTHGAPGDGPSRCPSLSDDGRYVAFASDATNLVSADTNGVADIFVRDLQTGATRCVSSGPGGVAANGASARPQFALGGAFVAFHSAASNLVEGDANRVEDVFVCELATGKVTRISLAPDGAEGDGPSGDASISRDGRYVAFASAAANFAAGDDNGATDIFLRDRDTNGDGVLDDATATTTCVTDIGGRTPNRGSAAPYISPNGRHVVFQSDASDVIFGDSNHATDAFLYGVEARDLRRVSTAPKGAESDGPTCRPTVGNDDVLFASAASNLVEGDANGLMDIFRHDINPGGDRPATELLVHGWLADGDSYKARIARDGRAVVYQSYAKTICGDETEFSDVFLYDMATRRTTRLSASADGAAGNDNSDDPSVSDAGRYAAFSSAASNLVPDDTNGQRDVFVRDLESGAIRRIPLGLNGENPHGLINEPTISADGRLLAFSTVAENIVPNDTNGKHDVFVYDLATGAIARVSVASNGAQADGDSGSPAFSDDGRFVTFTSWASNLAPQDRNGGSDVFVHDLETGATLPANVSSNSEYGNDVSAYSALSRTGRYVAFAGAATNLVPADTNKVPDIFVRDFQSGRTLRHSLNGFGEQADGESWDPVISADGRFVAFTTGATNLSEGDTNAKEDIYLYDSRACRAPALVAAPQDIVSCVDQVVTFTAVANGTPPLVYQWQKDGDDLEGENADRLTITGTVPEDSGQYTVLVANDCGLVSSAAATLTVKDCVAFVEMVSIGDGGVVRGGSHPALSRDGRYVAFHSEDPALVRDDLRTYYDVFVEDCATGDLVRISSTPDGQPGNEGSTFPSLSADGRFVAFRSMASNLVAGDTNGTPDVFVRDRDPDGNGILDEGNESTRRVSLTSEGGQVTGDNGGTFGPKISADGRFVTFVSDAREFPGANGRFQVYVHDLGTGATTRASSNLAGEPGDDDSVSSSISDDGRYVAFRSRATNLSEIDTVYEDVFVHDCATGITELVSVDSDGNPGNNESRNPEISADGRYVGFVSRATNLVAGDTNGVDDMFVHDRQTGATCRISVDSSGVQANRDSFYAPSISENGRLVAFYSEASNLVSGDTNNVRDAFVHDLDSGQTIRVSVNDDGVQGDDSTGLRHFGVGYSIALSADGASVAFFSRAHNLARGAEGDLDKVFVRDLEARTTRPASLSGRGIPGGNTSQDASISADGNLVAFNSLAPDLVALDTNSAWDVFLRDLAAGRTGRLNLMENGRETDSIYQSGGAVFSADGRYVAFYTTAPLIAADTNGRADVYVRELATGQMALVSVASDGTLGDNDSGGMRRAVAISDDGRIVAFVSWARNLVPGDTNGWEDVFVHDRDPDENGVFDESGATTTRVSVGLEGQQSNSSSGGPTISSTGRFVAFVSSANNLVPGDSNNRRDIFVHDRETGRTQRVSVASNGDEANDESGEPFLSASGRVVAFSSIATNLVADDTNRASDIFLHNRETGETTRISMRSDGGQANGHSNAPAISRSGGYLVFQSDATNLVSNDTNNATDVFLCDLASGAVYRLSTDSGGDQADNWSSAPAITDDGRIAAFHSAATNLVDYYNRATVQVYRYKIAERFGFRPDGGRPGDSNCDGSVDFNDIDAFVAALIGRAGYQRSYPYCEYMANNDINRDGSVDFDDIDLFVACLINGGCP